MRAASSSSRCWSQSRPKTRSAMATPATSAAALEPNPLPTGISFSIDRSMGGNSRRCARATVSAVCQIRFDASVGIESTSRPAARMQSRSAGRKRHVRYIRKAKPSVSKPGPRFALDAGTRTTVCANIKPDYIPAVRPGARCKPGGRFKRAAPGEPPSPMNPVSPLPAIGGNLAADGDLADAPAGSIGLALLQVGLHARLRSDISRPDDRIIRSGKKLSRKSEKIFNNMNDLSSNLQNPMVLWRGDSVNSLPKNLKVGDEIMPVASYSTATNIISAYKYIPWIQTQG